MNATVLAEKIEMGFENTIETMRKPDSAREDEDKQIGARERGRRHVFKLRRVRSHSKPRVQARAKTHALIKIKKRTECKVRSKPVFYGVVTLHVRKRKNRED